MLETSYCLIFVRPGPCPEPSFIGPRGQLRCLERKKKGGGEEEEFNDDLKYDKWEVPSMAAGRQLVVV